jgi:hypothetical protein
MLKIYNNNYIYIYKMDIMASMMLTCIQTANIKFSIHKDQICTVYLCPV